MIRKVLSSILAVSLLEVRANATLGGEGTQSLMKTKAMQVKVTGHSLAAPDPEARASANKIKGLGKNKELACVNGSIEGGTIPCKDINLVAFLTGEELGSPYASNTDPIFFATYVSALVTEQ